jgi:hypothetical protein
MPFKVHADRVAQREATAVRHRKFLAERPLIRRAVKGYSIRQFGDYYQVFHCLGTLTPSSEPVFQSRYLPLAEEFITNNLHHFSSGKALKP